MESESFPKPNPKFRVMKQTSLEDYLAFFHSDKHPDFTVSFLNQVISIHGFKKIFKRPKKMLIDAVNAIDLIDPSRNTLKDNISSCAFITVEDVITDLNELNWQECCVTSLQTLNSGKESLSTHHSPGLQSTDLSNPNSQTQDPIQSTNLSNPNSQTQDPIQSTNLSNPNSQTQDPKRMPFSASGFGLQGASSSCVSEIAESAGKQAPKRKKRRVAHLFSNSIVPYRSL